MKIRPKIISLALIIIAASATPLGVVANKESPSANTVLNTVISAHAGNASNQVRINQLDDQSKNLAEEYRSLLRQKKSLDIYNEQLERLISSQQEELSSIEQQIKEIDVTQREITPLMISMLDALERFIQLDVPFLPSERTKRISDLKALLDRADVSVSEKFRKVIEAYQIENDYGRTIEAYRAPLALATANTTKTVDYLRIGRVAFFYQSIDGAERAFWDVNKKRWQPLDDSYRRNLNQGLRIARKQSAPDLLVLPVSSPRKATINNTEKLSAIDQERQAHAEFK